MELTRKDKEIFFKSLIIDLVEFQKSKIQAKRFFEGKKLDTIIERINSEEDESYNLIVRISEELGIEIPEYHKTYKIRR